MSSVSNGLYFLTLPLVSVMRVIKKYVMRVIYTSKGMSKKFGVRVIHLVRVIYRKIRYLQRTNRFIFFLAPQNSHIIYPVPYFDSSYAYSYWLCLQGSTSFLYQLIYVS